MHDNYHYPAGADGPNAPWNQHDIPEEEFNITYYATLRKDVTITTDDYIPGASGVDYEPDDEGGYYAEGWHDPDDTSETNWKAAFEDNGYNTPLELINLLKDYLQKDLENIDRIAEETKTDKSYLKRKLEGLIEECNGWAIEEELFE